MKNPTVISALFLLALIFIPSGIRGGEDPSAIPWNDFFRETTVGQADSVNLTLIMRYPDLSCVYGSAELGKIITAFICTGVISGDTLASPDSVWSEMRSEYRELLDDFPDHTMPWILQRQVDVQRIDANFICIRKNEFRFTGGAHPNTNTRLLTLNRKTGTLLHLDGLHDIINPDSLLLTAERQFRALKDIPDNESLEEAGWWFDGGIFTLPDNFAVLEDGILFHYDPYEIGPYYLGHTELFIPLVIR